MENVTNPEQLRTVATRYLGQGDADGLRALCVQLWDSGVRWPELLALRLRTAVQLGHLEEITMLADPGQWISLSDSVMPNDFNRSLASIITSSSALVRCPKVNASLDGGLLLPDLGKVGNQEIGDLLKVIEESAVTYVKQRADFLTHPFIECRPPTTSMSTWALVMLGSAHQDWHYHPDAWLSGVYYVTVPEAQKDQRGAGSIEFGPLPADATARAVMYPKWRVVPKGGSLLLFPSYIAHRTLATDSDEPRISVAFDFGPTPS